MGLGAAAGGLAVGGASLLNSSAAKSGSNQMATGQMLAAMIQQQMFNTVQNNDQPFISNGTNASNSLATLTGTNAGGNPLTAPLTAQFQPTMAQLSATPGYQFSLQQGLMATQNGYAAQGLGSSGNALMGGANYAQGLASTTYQQQLQNYMAQNQQTYNMLNGQVGSGLTAAGQVAGAAGTASTNMGASVASAGNALGQGTVASTSALTSPLATTGYLAAGNPQFSNSLSTAGGSLSNFFGGGALSATGNSPFPSSYNS
jgi:hypothetical protein